MTSPDISTPTTAIEAAESLMENGYAVLPALLDGGECAFARQVHDELIAAGLHSDHGDWGYGLHPLCRLDQRLCHLFAHPLLIEIASIALQDRVALRHAGSRVQDTGPIPHEPRIPWHNHAFEPELRSLHPDDPRRGSRPKRLLANWYLDGSTPESGSLMVLPRRYDDRLAPPSNRWQEPWPGQVEVVAPPGSAVIFTIDLWHTATPGSSGRRRRITGAHLQAAGHPIPHPEDQPFTGAGIDDAKRRLPAFAELLRPS